MFLGLLRRSRSFFFYDELLKSFIVALVSQKRKLVFAAITKPAVQAGFFYHLTGERIEVVIRDKVG
jgi:hypothetical protein